MGLELFEEFWVQVGVCQGSVLSPLIFAIAVDVITENARQGLMNEILYANELILIEESIKNLSEKFLKWQKAFENKDVKVNLKKAIVRGRETFEGEIYNNSRAK